jgi:pilus assembly protein CpaC
VGSFSPTRLSDYTTANGNLATSKFSVSDALNIFAFWPHLDVGATLKDLASKNVLQILAEPNVLAMNGKEASFITGGEFPFPTLQGGGSGVGQITVSFREFGVRIHFLPTITPRGTIRLHVTPEVSSLDYANALTVSGITIPGLNTRRVDTEIELENGQTFAIAGLLDRRTTEAMSKIPGLADIPVLGKIFQTRTLNRTNSELLILVTPELVAPIPADKPAPDLERPLKFMEGPGVMTTPPRTPGADVTGPPAVKPRRTEIPVQELESIELNQKSAPGQAQGFAPGQMSRSPQTPTGPTPGAAGPAGGDPAVSPTSGNVPQRPPQ